jgi:hypothetical protein
MQNDAHQHTLNTDPTPAWPPLSERRAKIGEPHALCALSNRDIFFDGPGGACSACGQKGALCDPAIHEPAVCPDCCWSAWSEAIKVEDPSYEAGFIDAVNYLMTVLQKKQAKLTAILALLDGPPRMPPNEVNAEIRRLIEG